MLLDCFWALGACFEVLLAAAVMPWGGWRLLLALSALPALAFVTAAAFWVPESARFNAARGEVGDISLAQIRVSSCLLYFFRPILPWRRWRGSLPKTNSP